MSPPPTESPQESTGPPDRQTLRLLERHLAKDSLVADTVFDPNAHEPHLLRASLDASRYPTSTESARLDVRWFESGDFSIHYVESSPNGGRWECRWDRHPNDHNTRLHFHRPPDGDAVADLSLPSLHPLEVYSTVLTALEQRLETQWATDR